MGTRQHVGPCACRSLLIGAAIPWLVARMASRGDRSCPRLAGGQPRGLAARPGPLGTDGPAGRAAAVRHRCCAWMPACACCARSLPPRPGTCAGVGDRRADHYRFAAVDRDRLHRLTRVRRGASRAAPSAGLGRVAIGALAWWPLAGLNLDQCRRRAALPAGSAPLAVQSRRPAPQADAARARHAVAAGGDGDRGVARPARAATRTPLPRDDAGRWRSSASSRSLRCRPRAGEFHWPLPGCTSRCCRCCPRSWRAGRAAGGSPRGPPPSLGLAAVLGYRDGLDAQAARAQRRQYATSIRTNFASWDGAGARGRCHVARHAAPARGCWRATSSWVPSWALRGDADPGARSSPTTSMDGRRNLRCGG